jgi:hypothetical protein
MSMPRISYVSKSCGRGDEKLRAVALVDGRFTLIVGDSAPATVGQLLSINAELDKKLRYFDELVELGKAWNEWIDWFDENNDQDTVNDMCSEWYKLIQSLERTPSVCRRR